MDISENIMAALKAGAYDKAIGTDFVYFDPVEKKWGFNYYSGGNTVCGLCDTEEEARQALKDYQEGRRR